MATTTGSEYDHITISDGTNQTVHYLKDTAARNDISDLKSATASLNHNILENVYDWRIGAYDQSSGARTTLGTRISTRELFSVGQDGYLHVTCSDPNIPYWIGAYNSDGSYYGLVKANNVLPYEGYLPGKKYTITVRYGDNRTITDISALSSLMTVETHLAEEIYDMLELYAENEKLLFGPSDLVKGVYQNSGEINASRNYYSTKPISLLSGTVLEITLNNGFGVVLQNVTVNSDGSIGVSDEEVITESINCITRSNLICLAFYKGSEQSYTLEELFKNAHVRVHETANQNGSIITNKIVFNGTYGSAGNVLKNINVVTTLPFYIGAGSDLYVDVNEGFAAVVCGTVYENGVLTSVYNTDIVTIPKVCKAQTDFIVIRLVKGDLDTPVSTTAAEILNNIHVMVYPAVNAKEKVRRYNPYTWENYGYYTITGERTADQKTISTAVGNDLRYVRASANYEIGLLAYKLDGTYVGWYRDGKYQKTIDIWRAEIYIPDDGNNHVLVVRNANDHNANVATSVGSTDIYYQFTINTNRTLMSDVTGDVFGIVQDQIANTGNVVFVLNEIWVKKEDDKLYISYNSGKDWHANIDISSIDGTIKNIYVYETGTLALFTSTTAYRSDWDTLTEVPVYEADGETEFVSTGTDQFTTFRVQYRRIRINNKEIYAFGNYTYTTQTRTCLFYSDDDGQSYKVFYEFNLNDTLTIRHIHDVVFNPYDGMVWVTTGDHDGQRHVIKFDYNTTTSTWSHEVVGSGSVKWKWCGLTFERGKGYYCQDDTPGSVWMFNIDDASDINKHICLLRDVPNDPIGLFVGSRGDILITLSIYRSDGRTTTRNPSTFDARKLYYAKDGYNFSTIMGPINNGDYDKISYYFYSGPTQDGKILAHYYTKDSDLNWESESVFLDDALRNEGYVGAFFGDKFSTTQIQLT